MTEQETIGFREFWEHCVRFFGRHNFSHEEIMGIMHHINSIYFMGKISKLNGEDKGQDDEDS